MFSRAARDGVHPWAVSIPAFARRLVGLPLRVRMARSGGVFLRVAPSWPGKPFGLVWSRGLSRLCGPLSRFRGVLLLLPPGSSPGLNAAQRGARGSGYPTCLP